MFTVFSDHTSYISKWMGRNGGGIHTFMASIFLVNKVRSLVMLRWSVFKIVLLRREDLEQLQVEREPVEYKQNDKSCAYPSTILKFMSN